MENSSIMGMIALLISIGGTIIGIINHRRCRSSCMGKKLEASIDIENTTPQQVPRLSLPPPSLEIKNSNQV